MSAPRDMPCIALWAPRWWTLTDAQPRSVIHRGRHRTCDAAGGDSHDAVHALGSTDPSVRAGACDHLMRLLDDSDELRTHYPIEFFDDLEVSLQSYALVKGLIEPGTTIVVYGPSGSGKTAFAIDLAACIAANVPWRGRKVRPGLCIYVAAEAGGSIKRRFIAWRDSKLTETRIEKIPLAIMPSGPSLLDPAAFERFVDDLRAVIRKHKLHLALVIFDTLSRSIPGGDENAARDMTMVVAAADRIREELGAAVMLVHHSGKDSSKGARGHGALSAAADTVIAINDRVATLEKVRDGVAGEQFGFELEPVSLGTDQDGDEITACILKHIDSIPVSGRLQPRLSGVAQVALQALHEAIGEYGEPMPATSSIPAGVKAVTMAQWRERFRLRYGSDPDGEKRGSDAVKKAFKRGRELLAGANLVMVSDPYVWTTRGGRDRGTGDTL